MKDLGKANQQYFADLAKWLRTLPALELDFKNIKPEEIAILAVDMTDGFCTAGALASPRMARIKSPIISLLKSMWEKGVHNIFLINDDHVHDAVEFDSYPPHCVAGTPESIPIAGIRALPFYDQLTVIGKNSVSSHLNTDLRDRLAGSPKLKLFIVVGDCTDICVYLLAMFLRADANSQQIRDRRVIVPANCVETYDMPVEIAEKIGAVPHPADLLHAIFLQHMHLNGIEVVSKVQI